MNTELKAMLAVLFKMYPVVKDIVEKAPIEQDLVDVTNLGLALPAAISNISSFMSEVEALSNPANLEDVLAYIASEFAGVVTTSAQAAAILNASIKLVSDVISDSIALQKAIVD